MDDREFKASPGHIETPPLSGMMSETTTEGERALPIFPELTVIAA